eukprot:2552080-Prymnesium_polylepis.1
MGHRAFLVSGSIPPSLSLSSLSLSHTSPPVSLSVRGRLRGGKSLPGLETPQQDVVSRLRAGPARGGRAAAGRGRPERLRLRLHRRHARR